MILAYRRINIIYCIMDCLVLLATTMTSPLLVLATSSTTTSATRSANLSFLDQSASKLMKYHQNKKGRSTSHAKHDAIIFDQEDARTAAAADDDILHDFELHLKFLGKDSIDNEAFGMLLDDIGYKRCREGLFENFLAEVANASPDFNASKDEISIRDLYHLYQSDPYKLPTDVAYASGEALLSRIDNLFEKADVSGDKLLDSEEFGSFLLQLFDGRELSDNELREVRIEICWYLVV